MCNLQKCSGLRGFFCILEYGLLISWAELLQSFCFALPSHHLLHRSRALLGSFQYRKCLRKWIYMEIFPRHWILLAIRNNPAISTSIALSYLIPIAEMVYHQLLGFSFPSTWSYPSSVWRIQKRKQPFYTSHSLTFWERKKKQWKDFKIVPSRNKHNKHSVEADKWSIQTILFSIVATTDII